MRRSLVIVVVSLITLAASAIAAPIKFARYPHSSHGKIAFSYHGDIWVANENGSNARRLTAHVAQDSFPRFSPDGQWIAFTSNRMGNNDVFLVATGGGSPTQLTHHTTNDTGLYWTPDGERIIFSTSRGSHAFYTPLHTVSREGDLPVPMNMDQGAAGMISQDGSKIAFNRYGVRYWRKGYRGNSNTDVWVQDLASQEITQLTDIDQKEFRTHTQDAYPMWGADGNIYFMSERDGIFNIWRTSPNGSGLRQVTRHGSDGVQYPSMSPDGKVITYENEFELWRLEVPRGTPRKVEISLDFDPKANMVEYLTSSGQADGFHPSPDGRYIAVDHHGEIFIVPTDPEVGEKKQVTASGWRQRSALWSPDGKKLSYVSDESGDQQFWVYEVESGDSRMLTSDASEKRQAVWAPDSSKLAFTAANSLLINESLAAGATRVLGTNPERGYQLGEFSPDGNWLVYSRRDLDLNTEVYVRELASGAEHNVTQDSFNDSSGIFSPDGKHIVFGSDREGGTTQIFRVSLARLTEDPDDPMVKERKLLEAERSGRGRGGRGGARGGRGGSQEEAEAAPIEAITVDSVGIRKRAVQITEESNAVRTFFLSKDGRTIYFLGQDDRGSALLSISIDGGKTNRLAGGGFGGITPTADRSKVFFRPGSGGRGGRRGRGGRGGGAPGPVMMMPLAGGNLQNKQERVDFSFTVSVDKPTEWRQIFDEAWRVMKYRFYDENMHGVDWKATRARYEGLLDYVGQNQDLYDLTNEMIGELNASHTGVSGPSGIDQPDTYSTAEVGFEIESNGTAYVVGHIYRDGPADKEWIDIQPGDIVQSIDGKAIRPPENYWKVLNHSLNDYVTVSLDSSARNGGAHDIRLRTVGSLRNIKYEEWVVNNRKYVEQVSGGQIGYVHIRSMNQASLRRFENEINQFWNAKGIVVDIRYNGGGNIDQQLLDILERRPYEFWNNRWASDQSGRRPRQAIAGPKVMLINRRSGSDSEVTPMGFRDLGLGHIVGTPTSGAVIATGSYSLINGGRIRTPGSLVVTYDPSKPMNRGINLENYGVAPDVWVENSPQDELDSFDRELKAAVDEALQMLRGGSWQFTTDGGQPGRPG